MKVRHVLGISGGKDSAALAIYMRDKYPDMDIDYYMSDTGKELNETIDLVNRIQIHLGKNIKIISGAEKSAAETPFDHFLQIYRGYLPSSQARWCTKNLKLKPFETEIGDIPTISYVGIRGDEDREGYVSIKPNIQSIFPFRRNIWSLDVINKVLNDSNMSQLSELYKSLSPEEHLKEILEIVHTPLTKKFYYSKKLNALLDCGVALFNKVVFEYLKTTDYPIGKLDEFPLIENEDILVRKDIFRILEESGVGIPSYYQEKSFVIDGKVAGYYNRSRSGCYFCFYQQKIEWVWLYETHPDLFKKAMEYEKDGYTWQERESLAELSKPKRIRQIKEEYLQRMNRKAKAAQSPYLLDILAEDEENLCASCFI